MMPKLPTHDELAQQIAQAEEERRQLREATLQYRDNFCPISLADWLALCQLADVPHIPAEKVVEILTDDYRTYELPGEHRTRLESAWQSIQQAAKPNHMMRLDCCSDANIKYHLSQGEPSFQEEYQTIMFGDMRSYDIVDEYPRDALPVWQRQWVQTQQVSGYPVEYRAFVKDGQLMGISNYFPQRPLPRYQQHLDEVSRLTQKLIDHAQPPFLWHHTFLMLGNPLDLQGVHFTADFLVDHQDRVLFLEGGPPHELGAHMCCFQPGQIEGIALTDRNAD